MTDTRRSEIREAAIEYRHILDYDDNDLPEEQISELIDFILELTAPRPPKAQPEESQEVTKLKAQVEYWANFAIWFNQDYFGFSSPDYARASVEKDLQKYNEHLERFTLVRKPGKEEKG